MTFPLTVHSLGISLGKIQYKYKGAESDKPKNIATA